MQDNNTTLEELKEARESVDFEALDSEAKVGMLLSEVEESLKDFETLVKPLSKGALQRVLRVVLNYPVNNLKMGYEKNEQNLCKLALHIEHLKILTLKHAEQLGMEQQKEETNGISEKSTES